MKNLIVFTTSQVAKMCHCSANHIVKLCNKGILEYFLVPGSKHRRITRQSLINFMKDNRIPIEDNVNIGG